MIERLRALARKAKRLQHRIQLGDPIATDHVAPNSAR
jgi:hypothetical protein